MTLSLNCQTILWPIQHIGHPVRWPLGIGESSASLCLSHEPACENYLDYAYSVIDGQFFNDELVTLKL